MYSHSKCKIYGHITVNLTENDDKYFFYPPEHFSCDECEKITYKNKDKIEEFIKIKFAGFKQYDLDWGAKMYEKYNEEEKIYTRYLVFRGSKYRNKQKYDYITVRDNTDFRLIAKYTETCCEDCDNVVVLDHFDDYFCSKCNIVFTMCVRDRLEFK